MSENLVTDQAVIGVFVNRLDAQTAVSTLQSGGIPGDTISVIGGDSLAHEAALGHYEPPEFVEMGVLHEGERKGAMLGGFYGMLAGCAAFFLPGVGLLVALGPIAGLIGGTAFGAVVGGLFGEATFTEIAADYRVQLANGNWLVMIHCEEGDEDRVTDLLNSARPISTQSKVVSTATKP